MKKSKSKMTRQNVEESSELLSLYRHIFAKGPLFLWIMPIPNQQDFCKTSPAHMLRWWPTCSWANLSHCRSSSQLHFFSLDSAVSNQGSINTTISLQLFLSSTVWHGEASIWQCCAVFWKVEGNWKAPSSFVLHVVRFSKAVMECIEL